jgi:hypothetical protein
MRRRSPAIGAPELCMARAQGKKFDTAMMEIVGLRWTI